MYCFVHYLQTGVKHGFLDSGVGDLREVKEKRTGGDIRCKVRTVAGCAARGWCTFIVQIRGAAACVERQRVGAGGSGSRCICTCEHVNSGWLSSDRLPALVSIPGTKCV